MTNQKIPTLPGAIILVIIAMTVFWFVWVYEKSLVYEYIPFKIQPETSLKRAVVTDELEKKTNENKGCYLYRLTDVDKKVVFHANTCFMPIAQWGDFLFFPKGDGYNRENIKLIAHNIVTGEEQEIFSLHDNLTDFDGRLPYEIYQIDVINKKLYFSLGGYITSGAFYSIDLPFEKKHLKLLDKRLFKIEFDGRRYWITGGMGDAGVGSQYRMTFNVDTQKIGPKIITMQDLDKGTSFIGSNGKVVYIEDYRISQDHSSKEFQEIYSLDVNNPKIKKTIFSKSDLPKNLKNALYYEKTGEFLFNNGEVTAYNLKTKKIKIINQFAYEAGDGLALRNGIIFLSDTAELNIDTGKIIENRKGCDRGGSDLKDYIQELNLPSVYSFKEYLH